MLQTDWIRNEVKSCLDVVLAGKGKASANGEKGETSPAGPMAASAQVIARLQKEMRLSKQQARRMWENVLYAVAAESGETQSVASVEGMVAAVLEAQVAGAKAGSQGKAVVDTEAGFVMFRSRKAMEAAAPGSVPVEGMSAEQQREAIQEAVALRVDEMRRLIGIKPADDAEDVIDDA